MADERDPKVSQRYRELGAEEPSRELDARILAAARRATDRAHAPLVTPAGRHRWYYSLAAAAVLVLAVAVTIHVERQQPDPELATPVLPPPAAPAPPAEEAPAPAPVPKPAAKPRAKAAAPQVFTPDPQPRAVDEARQAERALGARSDEMRAQREAATAAAEARSPARARAESARAMSRMAAEPPEKQLERIAALRKEGRHEEADKALAEFRRLHPDYRIPEAMLEKFEKR